MSFETRKKVTAPRQDITGSPNIYYPIVVTKQIGVHGAPSISPSTSHN
ncbi:MAG: hypothetical protein JRI33_04565 [Deltaproteobacteria bacterium]|nr:hypothetical protein [Deltaproteobacteria bacterium]